MKGKRQSAKKNPVVPSRDEVIEMVRELGGEAEVKRYEKVEGLEKTHSQGDVLHRWKVGDIMGADGVFAIRTLRQQQSDRLKASVTCLVQRNVEDLAEVYRV